MPEHYCQILLKLEQFWMQIVRIEVIRFGILCWTVLMISYSCGSSLSIRNTNLIRVSSETRQEAFRLHLTRTTGNRREHLITDLHSFLGPRFHNILFAIIEDFNRDRTDQLY